MRYLFYDFDKTYNTSRNSSRDLEVTDIVTMEGEEIHVRKGWVLQDLFNELTIKFEKICNLILNFAPYIL